jgi:hypothetical protein
MRLLGVLLGGIGALAGLAAAGYAFVIYMVEGLNGMGNPYADRVGFGIAAFVLALVAAVGAVLLYRRPELGSLLMVAGSILGAVAINLFYINTWYVASVPLCLLGAILALAAVGKSAGAITMRWLTLAVALASAVAAYFFAGWVAAAILGAILVLGLALVLLPATRTA